MKSIKRLFGHFPMPWRRVLLFALLCAVYTAAVNLLPALHDTSFTDIAVNPECWILFAVFLTVNCKTAWEAAVKCFVFFLISQPLIYLLEVPFSPEGFGLFRYYKYWFFITLLTLPGAAVAFLLKRRDWLSAAVLAVADVFLAYMSATYLRGVTTGFPRHLLSAVFCLALAVFFCFVLLDKPGRFAVLLLCAAVFLGTFVWNGRGRTKAVTLSAPDTVCTVTDPQIVSAAVSGDTVRVTARKNGTTEIICTDPDGNREILLATVSGGGVWLDRIDTGG